VEGKGGRVLGWKGPAHPQLYHIAGLRPGLLLLVAPEPPAPHLSPATCTSPVTCRLLPTTRHPLCACCAAHPACLPACLQEFLRGPYFVLIPFCIGAYLCHPLMQRAAYYLGW